jgi:hypothetical protein
MQRIHTSKISVSKNTKLDTITAQEDRTEVNFIANLKVTAQIVRHVKYKK